MDEGSRAAWLRAVAATIAFVTAMCLIAALLGGCARADATERIDCPLDAVRYPTPTFAGLIDLHPTWRVVDRQSHRAWWLLWMDGGYVALPIGEELNGDE